RLAIFERLKAEGIEIPYPQSDFNINAASAENLARAFSAADAGRAKAEPPAAANVEDAPVGTDGREIAAPGEGKIVPRRKPTRRSRTTAQVGDTFDQALDEI